MERNDHISFYINIRHNNTHCVFQCHKRMQDFLSYYDTTCYGYGNDREKTLTISYPGIVVETVSRLIFPSRSMAYPRLPLNFTLTCHEPSAYFSTFSGGGQALQSKLGNQFPCCAAFDCRLLPITDNRFTTCTS